MAIKQLKNMQQAMRQDTVNNQKEVLKLRSELKIKMEKREKEMSMTMDSKAAEKRLGRSPAGKKGNMAFQKGKRSNSQGDAKEGGQIDPDMLVNSPLVSWLK